MKMLSLAVSCEREEGELVIVPNGKLKQLERACGQKIARRTDMVVVSRRELEALERGELR